MKKRILTVILAATLIIISFQNYVFGAQYVSAPYKEITHDDKFQGYIPHYGVDISAYNGTVDWMAAKNAGVEFAYIKVGARGYGSEGNMIADPNYAKNIEGAQAAGIKVGVYIFSQAITLKEAEEEAAYILKRIEKYKIDLHVVIDYEFTRGSSTRLRKALEQGKSMTKHDATDIVNRFCYKVREAGYRPMIYANVRMLNKFLVKTDIPEQNAIWLASWSKTSNYNSNYICWQYSGNNANTPIIGKSSYIENGETKYWTSGIKHVVDMNVLYDNGKFFTESYQKPEPEEPVEVLPEPETPVTPEEPQGPVIEKVDGLALKTRTTSSVTINWDKVADAEKYNIYRSASYTGTYKLLASTEKTSYKDSSLTQGREYYYRVEAVNGDLKGSKSNKFAAAVKPKYDRYGETTEKDINLRTQADKDYRVLTMVGKNEKLTVLASSRDKDGNVWYKVRYQADDEEITGYMISDYLKITKKGTTTEKLNMRKGAGVKYSSVTVIPEGKRLTLYSVKSVRGVSWYKVKYKVKGKYKTGWICGTYVKAVNLE